MKYMNLLLIKLDNSLVFGSSCGSNAWLSVPGELIGHGEFSKISAYHVEFDIDIGEDLSGVDSHDGSDHLGHDDRVSQMGFYCFGLFPWLEVLLAVSDLHHQICVLVVQTSSESSSLTTSELFT